MRWSAAQSALSDTRKPISTLVMHEGLFLGKIYIGFNTLNSLNALNNSFPFETLEAAYSRGQHGKVESFDFWLSHLGIDGNLFIFQTIARQLRENLGSTVDRETELSAVVEFLGFFKEHEDGLFHIPIVGVRGIGKSHLLVTLAHFLQRKKGELKWKMIDASQFLSENDASEETQSFLSLLDEIAANRFDVLLIDSFEKDKNPNESLKEISKIFTKGVIITSWTPYHWDAIKDSVEEFLSTSKEVYVGPLSEDSSKLLISTIIRMVSNGKYALDKDLELRISKYGHGIPTIIIGLLLRTFHETFVRKESGPAVEDVVLAARFLGLEGANERVGKLDDYQLLILKHLLLELDPRGTRPSKLVDILGKDKATVSYHLNELSKLQLLRSERVSRWVFYRVRDEVRPLIGLRLVQESDFLG